MNSKAFHPNQTTVLIPAFNEERFIGPCLDSVVNQADCVMIGDNASTDGTEAICREFAARYKHIRYIRHETNLGSVENSVRLAKLVETEYVMSMGGHDELPENYVSTLKCLLAANPDAVCAYGNCAYLEWDGTVSETLDFASVRTDMNDDNPYIRAASFFRGKQPWDLIFSLFRSSSAVPILTELKPIAGCDHVIPVATLLDGKYVYSPETTFLRRMVHPNDTDKDYIARIVGESSSHKMSRDYTAVGKEILGRVWKHRNQRDISPEREKAFKELLFQMAVTLGTPTGNLFWDRMFWLRSFWRGCCKSLKRQFLPGYAARKNM